METNVCNICIETFNKSTRTIVKCKCGFECCKKCVKTYLLNSSEDPSCMSCKDKWDTTFLQENFEKKFLTKEYKKHREDVLFEREKSMLQATQVYVENEIKIEKIKEEITKVEQKYIEQLNELHKEIKKVKNTTEKKKFIRKCPNNNCKGFLSSSLKCELCNCWSCSECRETTGYTKEERKEHKCKKEILESVKLLEKDSKPCPKCASLIFKIDGCDQIFCVECHTAFSWKTLRIETGEIHNPHYFEYQRRANNGIIPRNPMDIQCGRDLDRNLIDKLEEMEIFKPKLPKGWKTDIEITPNIFGGPEINKIVYISPKGKIQKKHPGGINIMVELCRRIIHIRNIDQQRFVPLDRLNKNLKLRIDYMRNKISEENFKKIIQKSEKTDMKRNEINNILGMFISAIIDLFYRLVDTNDRSILFEMEKLREYTNECLEKVGKTYNCKKYKINEEFYFV